jgi:hypothetical protein
MDPAKLPTVILDKHPELPSIGEALAAYREGRPITATCPTCKGPLHIEEIKAIGSLWVLCPNGCTRAHFQVEPEAVQ